MIIIGIPRTDEMDDYYMADEDLAFKLEQAGFHAKYMDYSVQYFKKNTKLIKYLCGLGLQV